MKIKKDANAIRLWVKLWTNETNVQTGFFQWANPGLFFVYFRSFQYQFYRKIVDLSWILTRIIGVEGKHAEHLTTTTAHVQTVCYQFQIDAG